VSEPPRLRDEAASPVERALLEAGSSYRASAALHAKTMAAVGLAGSAALAEVAGSTLSNFGWSKWLTSLSVLGATAAIPVGYYLLKDPTPVPAVAPMAQVAPKRVEVAPPPPVEAPAPVAPPLAEERKLPQSAEEPAPQPNPKPAPQRAPSLGREIDLIDTARAALSRGDARGALATLDAYSRLYPRGRLSMEAEVLRIDALERSGDADGARRRAEAFLRHHPKSVLSARVRRLLGG
jgi:hypothetical protein